MQRRVDSKAPSCPPHGNPAPSLQTRVDRPLGGGHEKYNFLTAKSVNLVNIPSGAQQGVIKLVPATPSQARARN